MPNRPRKFRPATPKTPRPDYGKRHRDLRELVLDNAGGLCQFKGENCTGFAEHARGGVEVAADQTAAHRTENNRQSRNARRGEQALQLLPRWFPRLERGPLAGGFFALYRNDRPAVLGRQLQGLSQQRSIARCGDLHDVPPSVGCLQGKSRPGQIA